MNHLDLLHKHLDAKNPHHERVGDWLHHGRLVHHGPGFYVSHAAGTFHSLGNSATSMPSDGIATLKLLP